MTEVHLTIEDLGYRLDKRLHVRKREMRIEIGLRSPILVEHPNIIVGVGSMQIVIHVSGLGACGIDEGK